MVTLPDSAQKALNDLLQRLGIQSATTLNALPLFILHWPDLKDLLPEHLFQKMVGYRVWVGETVIQACADFEIINTSVRLARIYHSPDSPIFDQRWLQRWSKISGKIVLIPSLQTTGLSTSTYPPEITEVDGAGRWLDPVSEEEFVQKIILEAERIALHDVKGSKF